MKVSERNANNKTALPTTTVSVSEGNATENLAATWRGTGAETTRRRLCTSTGTQWIYAPNIRRHIYRLLALALCPKCCWTMAYHENPDYAFTNGLGTPILEGLQPDTYISCFYAYISIDTNVTWYFLLRTISDPIHPIVKRFLKQYNTSCSSVIIGRLLGFIPRHRSLQNINKPIICLNWVTTFLDNLLILKEATKRGGNARFVGSNGVLLNILKYFGVLLLIWYCPWVW